MLDRTPYEIFARIIKFSYAHYPDLLPSFKFDEITLPPIKATHVCHSWRTALLSDPTMWTCVKLTKDSQMSPNQLNETLSRSCSAPLDVLIEQTQYLNSYTLELVYNMLSVISQQMHRCRQLQITISEDFVPSVSHCLNKPVPMLQNFYLKVDAYPKGSRERSDVLKGIHEILFSGDAPNLKRVHLQVISSLDDLQLHLFKNLTSLCLDFESSIDTDIDGDILLDILQSSPCLRMLAISWHISRQDFVLSMPSSRRIPLPYLQQLTFLGRREIDPLNNLLGHLDFPMENTMFDIVFWDSDLRISDTMPLSHLLKRRRPTFLSIYFGMGEVIAQFPVTMDQGLHSRFRNFITSRPTDPSNFLQLFNLSDVKNMWLGDRWVKSDTLRGIFAALANLQFLCIHHGNGNNIRDLPDYLKVLMHSPPPSNSQTRANSELETDDITSFRSNIKTGQGQLFLCPSLRKLKLLFHSRLPVKLDEAYLQALVQYSTIREQAGYPFEYQVTHVASRA